MKDYISFVLAFSLVVSNYCYVSAGKRPASPDKRIVVIMNDKEGQKTYEVCRDGKPSIRFSSSKTKG